MYIVILYFYLTCALISSLRKNNLNGFNSLTIYIKNGNYIEMGEKQACK